MDKVEKHFFSINHFSWLRSNSTQLTTMKPLRSSGVAEEIAQQSDGP